MILEMLLSCDHFMTAGLELVKQKNPFNVKLSQ